MNVLLKVIGYASAAVLLLLLVWTAVYLASRAWYAGKIMALTYFERQSRKNPPRKP